MRDGIGTRPGTGISKESQVRAWLLTNRRTNALADGLLTQANRRGLTTAQIDLVMGKIAAERSRG